MTTSLIECFNVEALIDGYRAALPWPHAVVDLVLDEGEAAAVVAEGLAVPASGRERQDTHRVRKDAIGDWQVMGDKTRRWLEELNEPTFVDALSRLTGVPGLVADASLYNSGLFITPTGGWHRVHEDFPRHPHTGLWHRAAALLYCSDWAPGWGGELELWPPDMSAVGRTIPPLPGRLVVFETGPATRHGLRTVQFPNGAPRVVLATRYYSPVAPLLAPSRPLHAWSRRPTERLSDVLPTPPEILASLRLRWEGWRRA